MGRLDDEGGNHDGFVAIDLLFSGCELNSSDVSDVDCSGDDEWDRTDMDLGPQQVTASHGEEIEAEGLTASAADEATLDYTVVGHPENVALTSLKSTIQEFSGAACDISDIAGEVSLPDVTLLTATITDDDKNALTGLRVLWTAASNTDVGSGKVVKLAVASDVSIKSDAGDAAVNLACGDETGTASIHAGVWWAPSLVVTLPVVRSADLGGPFLSEEWTSTTPTRPTL